MQLTWQNDNRSHIEVVLEDGEELGNFTGPVQISVPLDPGNREYQLIVAGGDEIGPPPKLPSMPRIADPLTEIADLKAELAALAAAVKSLTAKGHKS